MAMPGRSAELERLMATVVRTTLARIAGLLSGALIVLPVLAGEERQRGMADMRIAEKFATLAADAQRLDDIRSYTTC